MTEVIDTLIISYTKQVSLYTELTVVVQKIVGRMALSRGSIEGVMDLFDVKKELLMKIECERRNVHDSITAWQQCKHMVKNSEAVERLDALLAETQQSIRRFLDTEDQLRLYLERQMGITQRQVHP